MIDKMVLKFYRNVLCTIVFLFFWPSECKISSVDSLKDFRIIALKGGDGCQYLLESFARFTSNFTFCAVSNARPIRLCTQCLEYYSLVLEVHNDILHLENEAGEICKEKLMNLDRLQVVNNGFNYVTGLWKRANCNYCFDLNNQGNPETETNENTKEIFQLHNATIECIEEHRNDSTNIEADPLVCNVCKNKYLSLNQRYNELKDQIFCMDVVDMINTTRSLWSRELSCCLDRKQPEIIFLVATSIFSILPVLFYLGAFIFATSKEQKLSQQNRWYIGSNVPPSTSVQTPD